MKKNLSGGQLVLLFILLGAAGFGLSWLVSKFAWIDHISNGVWIASYLIVLPYWFLCIGVARAEQKGREPGKNLRRFHLIYAIVTVLIYILQLARLF